MLKLNRKKPVRQDGCTRLEMITYTWLAAGEIYTESLSNSLIDALTFVSIVVVVVVARYDHGLADGNAAPT